LGETLVLDFSDDSDDGDVGLKRWRSKRNYKR
jgi:hypothetical protein